MRHYLFAAYIQEKHLPQAKKVLLQGALKCAMGRIFNDKICTMGRYSFKY